MKNTLFLKIYIGFSILYLLILLSGYENFDLFLKPILIPLLGFSVYLYKKFPTKKIKLYSSETTVSEKREHFGDVNTYWAQYDVLIYTPTVSAGVSFEQKHFNKVFGYFTDQSCPVETCVQMIGRIRDVSDHAFYICLAATGNNLPATVDDIKSALSFRRENLLRKFDDSGLHIEYGPNGELIQHGGDYFHMWLENARMRNLSRNSFIRRFVHVVSLTGAQMKFMSSEHFENSTGLQMMVDGEINSEITMIMDEHKIARVEIRDEMCDKIASAHELTEAEIDEIHTIIMMQKDITPDQKYAFEKHRLRTDYKYYEGPIDKKFVDKYRDPKIRRMYKNITRIAGYTTIESAWRQLQDEERETHKYLMNLGEQSQYQDLNRKYVFDQHRYALSFLKLCGWAGIRDVQFVHKIVLAHNIRTGEILYWDNIRPACMEFSIKTPSMRTAALHRTNDDNYIMYMINPINKILTTMYGISIVNRKKDPCMFFLNQNRLFTLDPSQSAKKNIPLVVPMMPQIEEFVEDK